MTVVPRPAAFPVWGADIVKHLPALHRYALGLARNFHAAEDLVHDTVVKAYVSGDTFQPGSNLRAWLFTILRNTFYSGLRKHKHEVADAGGIYAAMLVTHPEHDARLAMTEFLGAFAQLSSEHRGIITLVVVSGHSYSEAARLTGVPVGTAKSRLNRARAQLTQTLDSVVAPRRDAAGDGAIPPPIHKAPQDDKRLFH
ncbi:MAG: sigma-70 family RNA polymerase sigma factor [Alphaproteobacteria bacterium]